jgi:hypothetical protein
VLDEITEKEIPKELENQNVQQQEQQVPQTPASVVRISTRLIIPPERYSPLLCYLLLTDSGEPECYEEEMQVDTKKKWVLSPKFHPHMATRTLHHQNNNEVIHGTELISQQSRRVKNYTK